MIPHRYTIYVIVEICKIFLVAITVFTGLIVVLGVVQKLITERIGALAITATDTLHPAGYDAIHTAIFAIVRGV